MRWWTHGDPLYVKPPVRPPYHAPGSAHPSWQGSNIGYMQAHKRIKEALGKARLQSCRQCKGRAAEWAYDGTDANERTEMVRGSLLRFSLQPEHYIPMCVKCHRQFDLGGARGL